MTKYFAFNDMCIMLSLHFATPGEKRRFKNLNMAEESDSTLTASHHAPCKHNITISSLVISLGTSSGGLTLFQRSQRVGLMHALFSKAEVFASGHTAICTGWCFQSYILEMTECVKHELHMQAPYRTIPGPQKRATKNECKVNYHPYMICMVVKAHHYDGIGQFVKVLYLGTCKSLDSPSYSF